MTYNEILNNTFSKYMPEGVKDRTIITIPVEDENPEPEGRVIDVTDSEIEEFFSLWDGVIYAEGSDTLNHDRFPYVEEEYNPEGNLEYTVDGGEPFDGLQMQLTLFNEQGYQPELAVSFVPSDDTVLFPTGGTYTIATTIMLTPEGESEAVPVKLIFTVRIRNNVTITETEYAIISRDNIWTYALTCDGLQGYETQQGNAEFFINIPSLGGTDAFVPDASYSLRGTDGYVSGEFDTSNTDYTYEAFNYQNATGIAIENLLTEEYTVAVTIIFRSLRFVVD